MPPPLAEWEIEVDARSLRIDFPLQGPGDGRVVATQPLDLPLSSTKGLFIGAWNNDGSYYSDGPDTFTLSELADLRPG